MGDCDRISSDDMTQLDKLATGNLPCYTDNSAPREYVRQSCLSSDSSEMLPQFGNSITRIERGALTLVILGVDPNLRQWGWLGFNEYS
jgi:hypothetical protein